MSLSYRPGEGNQTRAENSGKLLIIIAGKEANRIHRAHIELGKGILIKTPRRFDELVMFFYRLSQRSGEFRRDWTGTRKATTP